MTPTMIITKKVPAMVTGRLNSCRSRKPISSTVMMLRAISIITSGPLLYFWSSHKEAYMLFFIFFTEMPQMNGAIAINPTTAQMILVTSGFPI